MTTTMGALRLDAKESGIECMTPLDVLASIHFQWVMHDEGHSAEKQARRPTTVSVPHQTYVQGIRPAHLGVPAMLQQEDILKETRLSNLKTPQMTMMVNKHCLPCTT
jgi:hypothetical protein